MLVRVERALAVIADIMLWIAGFAMTVMMLHIAADVTFKYLLNKPIVATLEIVTWYYMVATVFLPIMYIQIQKKHLMVELFTINWPPRRLAILEGFVAVLGAVYVGTLTVLTTGHAIDQTISGEIQDATFFDLPIWPARWLLPIAAGGMVLVFIVQGIRDFTYGFTGRGAPSLQPKQTMEQPDAELPLEEA